MMSTALLLIATGPKYWAFARNLIASAKQYFVPHDVILFTDSPECFDVAHKIVIPSAGYPAATLNRYHTFLAQKELLAKYDYLWYSDTDMKFVSQVAAKDIQSEGVVATLHPGFVINRTRPCFVSKTGTPERRSQSTSYIPVTADNVYYCGGFNGGKAESYLRMAEKIRDMIDIDASNGIVPVWHDESALNRYLYDNPPARVLTPSYCHPEGYNMKNGGYGWEPETYPPVLLALNKDSSDRWVKPVAPVVEVAAQVVTHCGPRRSGPVPGSKSRLRPGMMKGNRWQ